MGKANSAKKNTILAAAVQAFQELGYDQASMDYIAEIAKASKRTVYNYFPSKEALFEAVLEQFLDKAFDLRGITYSSRESLELQLERFAEAKISVARDGRSRALWRMLFAVLVTQPALAAKALALADSKEDGLEQWLADAAKDKRLKVKDPPVAAEVFWSMFAGAFFWPQVIEEPRNKRETKALTHEFIRVFLAGYR